MNGCEWCITNGGITMLEMIYLKKIYLFFLKLKLRVEISKNNAKREANQFYKSKYYF